MNLREHGLPRVPITPRVSRLVGFLVVAFWLFLGPPNICAAGEPTPATDATVCDQLLRLTSDDFEQLNEEKEKRVEACLLQEIAEYCSKNTKAVSLHGSYFPGHGHLPVHEFRLHMRGGPQECVREAYDRLDSPLNELVSDFRYASQLHLLGNEHLVYAHRIWVRLSQASRSHARAAVSRALGKTEIWEQLAKSRHLLPEADGPFSDIVSNIVQDVQASAAANTVLIAGRWVEPPALHPEERIERLYASKIEESIRQFVIGLLVGHLWHLHWYENVSFSDKGTADVSNEVMAAVREKSLVRDLALERFNAPEYWSDMKLLQALKGCPFSHEAVSLLGADPDYSGQDVMDALQWWEASDEWAWNKIRGQLVSVRDAVLTDISQRDIGPQSGGLLPPEVLEAYRANYPVLAEVADAYLEAYESKFGPLPGALPAPRKGIIWSDGSELSGSAAQATRRSSNAHEEKAEKGLSDKRYQEVENWFYSNQSRLRHMNSEGVRQAFATQGIATSDIVKRHDCCGGMGVMMLSSGMLTPIQFIDCAGGGAFCVREALTELHRQMFSGRDHVQSMLTALHQEALSRLDDDDFRWKLKKEARRIEEESSSSFSNAKLLTVDKRFKAIDRLRLSVPAVHLLESFRGDILRSEGQKSHFSARERRNIQINAGRALIRVLLLKHAWPAGEVHPRYLARYLPFMDYGHRGAWLSELLERSGNQPGNQTTAAVLHVDIEGTQLKKGHIYLR